jgi:hypothetical protein
MTLRNKIEVTPKLQSPAYLYKLAALAATFVTPVATYLAAVEKPKSPELAILILAIGTALANFLIGLHTDAIKTVALNAATQAANRAPGDDGLKEE